MANDMTIATCKVAEVYGLGIVMLNLWDSI